MSHEPLPFYDTARSADAPDDTICGMSSPFEKQDIIVDGVRLLSSLITDTEVAAAVLD